MGSTEAGYFTNAFPDLEIRIVSKKESGEVFVFSTCPDVSPSRPAPKPVAFLMLTPGYHDVGMATPPGGEP